MWNQIIVLLCCLNSLISATEVKKCSGSKPFPLKVQIEDCDIPPCKVYRGSTARFEMQFVSHKYATTLTVKSKATTLGITIPYELPADAKNACSHLMYDAFCPLYPTEDVSFRIDFPINNYPEVSVKVEIYIVDQDNDVIMCYVVDLKVMKRRGSGNLTAVKNNDRRMFL